MIFFLSDIFRSESHVKWKLLSENFLVCSVPFRNPPLLCMLLTLKLQVRQLRQIIVIVSKHVALLFSSSAAAENFN